jgi:hypothetical protein
VRAIAYISSRWRAISLRSHAILKLRACIPLCSYWSLCRRPSWARLWHVSEYSRAYEITRPLSLEFRRHVASRWRYEAPTSRLELSASQVHFYKTLYLINHYTKITQAAAWSSACFLLAHANCSKRASYTVRTFVLACSVLPITIHGIACASLVQLEVKK